MDWLPSVVDPTTVCVGLLILALTLVWAYVMLGSTKQPDLSVLYEKESGAGKRTGKTRPKGKQVEGSPRVSDGNSSKPSTAKLSQKKQAKASVTTGTKQEEEGAGAKGRGKKSKVNTATTEKEPEGTPREEEDKGEWQTQLSRQQLRALRRQKKEESGGEGDRESTNVTPPGEVQGREGADTRVEGDHEGESPSPLVPLPASKPLPVGESLLTHDSPPTSESPATSENQSGSDGQDHPKPNSQIVNVEQALKDAARSSSSSPEDTATQSAEPQPTGEKAAVPQSEDQPSEPVAQEEWVVL